MTEDMKEAEFLTSIIKKIVDSPDEVQVKQESDQQGIKLTLVVHPNDMGKIIGSQGRTASAIRTIMHVYGGQHEARVSVLIEEPEGSTRPQRKPEQRDHHDHHEGGA